ncbi:MAG: aroA [Flavipsychrobacter sp.]|nr:aroA [Flavipsychrobacter sp.]
MKAIIEPSYINGTLTPPSSKSITQRAYAAALLHKGTTIIRNAGVSADDMAALNIIQQLGAKVVAQTPGVIEITSNGVVPVSANIDCGESGLSARLFTPIAALCCDPITIQGQGSLLKRPMDGFKQMLSASGVTISGFNGYLPFTVHGPLKARSIKVDASEGSQFLSGLLFALCYSATEPITIEVTGLKSKPYIDVTLGVLKHFGKELSHKYYKWFYIEPAKFTHTETVDMTVEADWSSASFMLVAGAIAGNMTVNNLSLASTQADKIVLDVLKNAGADMVIEDDVIITKKSRLQAFEFDATHCPDLFPVLSILAACSYGESYIKGVHRLFHKESNRVESVTEMLHDFAVPWSVEDDMLYVTGVSRLQGTVIDSFHDHRIAMAAAVGALRANGQVDVMNAESVSKSYPEFFNDLILCGGKCTFNNE